MNTFAERLKAAIADSDYNQTTIGEAVGRSKGTVSLWCTGATEPDIGTLSKMCDLLRVSADYLVRGVDATYLEADAVALAGRVQEMPTEGRRALYQFIFGPAVSDSAVERAMPITRERGRG